MDFKSTASQPAAPLALKNMKTIKKLFIEKHGYQCQICSLSTWLENPIILELDHIDGNHTNDAESNLRLLCPNCHSQTDTFRGKNITKRKECVTDDELLSALHESKNIRQALIKVGLVPKGLNYRRASKLLNLNYKNIDHKNSQFGTVWINNTKVNKKIKSDLLKEYIEAGWVKGRITTKAPPSAKGKIWVTNGIQSKFIYPDQIPSGFYPGRIVHSYSLAELAIR